VSKIRSESLSVEAGSKSRRLSAAFCPSTTSQDAQSALQVCDRVVLKTYDQEVTEIFRSLTVAGQSVEAAVAA
jgi:hypothetical protein